jgi:hypothetical protein
MDADLRVAAARYALNDLFVDDDLPRFAIEALSRGVESPSLLVLAGATTPMYPGELRTLFESALRELCIPIPGRRDAADLLKKHYAEQVVTGAIPPEMGAARIVWLYHAIYELLSERVYAGQAFGIAALLGAFYALDDVAPDDLRAETKVLSAIRTACADIAASAG